MRKAQFAPYSSQVLELKGGINENESSLTLKGGELIDCKNYQIAPGTAGGYKSISGYERYDGTGAPSDKGTTIVRVKDLSEEVTGSPNEFNIWDDPFLVSGEYGVDAIVSLETEDPDQVVAVGDTLTWGAVTGEVLAVLRNQAASDEHHGLLEDYRSNILEVPGELEVLGVHIYNREVYAFRKKVGINKIGMYKQDPSGWLEITSDLDYTGDHYFHFRNFNFSADTNEFSMYFVDGVNYCHEYDGTTLVAITDAPIAPTHLVIHGGFYLGLCYRGGSFQLFLKEFPAETWTGYFEFGMGHDIVEIEDAKEDASILFLDRGIKMVTGITEDEFILKSISDTANCRPYTVQELLGTFFYVDDNGVTTLAATDQYGNYTASGISSKFKKTLDDPKHTIISSGVSRDSSQYRVFFDDGQGIYITFEDQQMAGATLVEYDRNIAQVAHGKVNEDVKESIFFIDGTSGYVYKMDSGTSFDGQFLITRAATAFFHYGSPRTYKTFTRSTIEVAAEFGQTFSVKTLYDYQEEDGERGSIWYDTLIFSGRGSATWGESTWGAVIWGASDAATNRIYIYLQGIATNMSYKFLSKEKYRQPHVIQDIITDFTVNGRRV